MPMLQQRTLLAVLLVSGVGAILQAGDASALRVFSVPPGAIERACRVVAAGDPAIQPIYLRLLAEADRLLEYAPESVTQKERFSAGGDRHDYMSQAPYFWPNPSKPDGLPYIRKDGQRNPEATKDDRSDAKRMVRMTRAMKHLALAFRLSGKDAYAEHAAHLLRIWFLDPATRMNPHLDHAQAVPGANTGRGTGMIESRTLRNAVDAVGLLAGAPAWQAADQTAMESWFRAFLAWSMSSANGKSEAAATNNHGSFYDAQIAHFALFVRRDEIAKDILRAVPARRLSVQIASDGSQPLELSRTDSFAYSCFNLTALVELAILGDHLGLDLWQAEGAGGGSIKKAADFLLPYVEDQELPWPHRQKNQIRRTLGSALWALADVYDDPRYRALLRREAKDGQQLDWLWWWPTQRPHR